MIDVKSIDCQKREHEHLPGSALKHLLRVLVANGSELSVYMDDLEHHKPSA